MSRLDVAALYRDLDLIRQRRAGVQQPRHEPHWQFTGFTWREVAMEAGVSPSTLSRLAKGYRPDVDGLIALLVWSGTTDLSPYIAPTKEQP